jgi:hypothetical protein
MNRREKHGGTGIAVEPFPGIGRAVRKTQWLDGTSTHAPAAWRQWALGLTRISHTPRDDGGLYQGMALAVPPRKAI